MTVPGFRFQFGHSDGMSPRRVVSMRPVEGIDRRYRAAGNATARVTFRAVRALVLGMDPRSHDDRHPVTTVASELLVAA